MKLKPWRNIFGFLWIVGLALALCAPKALARSLAECLRVTLKQMTNIARTLSTDAVFNQSRESVESLIKRGISFEDAIRQKNIPAGFGASSWLSRATERPSGLSHDQGLHR